MKQQMAGQQQIVKVAGDPDKMALEDWWRQVSEADLMDTLVKLGEYGSHDLVELGRALAQMAGWEGLNDAQLAEIGCWSYLVGKVARATEAFAEKRWPSDDTWKDTAVYSTMVRRIRDYGSWG